MRNKFRKLQFTAKCIGDDKNESVLCMPPTACYTYWTNINVRNQTLSKLDKVFADLEPGNYLSGVSKFSVLVPSFSPRLILCCVRLCTRQQPVSAPEISSSQRLLTGSGNLMAVKADSREDLLCRLHITITLLRVGILLITQQPQVTRFRVKSISIAFLINRLESFL